jgi:hypothetical protein
MKCLRKIMRDSAAFANNARLSADSLGMAGFAIF